MRGCSVAGSVEPSVYDRDGTEGERAGHRLIFFQGRSRVAGPTRGGLCACAMLGPAFELEEGTGICCPLRTSGYLSMENSVLGLCNHRSHFLMWEVWHVFQVRNLAGRHLPSQVSTRVLGSQTHSTLPSFLSWFYHPTEQDSASFHTPDATIPELEDNEFLWFKSTGVCCLALAS